MANFIVTDPNGNEHQVEAPDGADDGSILGFVHNMINQAGTAIQNQWEQGQPYREAMGAALTGNFDDAKTILGQKIASLTPQDVNEGIMNTALGFAGHIKDPLFDKALELSRIQGFTSVPGLKRNLNIPPDRAQSILDQLQSAGHITPNEGNTGQYSVTGVEHTPYKWGK